MSLGSPVLLRTLCQFHLLYFFWDTDLTDLHGLKKSFSIGKAKSFHESVFIRVHPCPNLK